MNKPSYHFGDIVSIAGYHPQVFIVDGYREERYYYPNEQWTDLVYELHCANSGEWIEADDDDLSLVVQAEQADEYLAVNPAPAPMRATDASGLLSFMFGGDDMQFGRNPEPAPRKPTARELSAKEAEERKAIRKARAAEIDNLLEQRKWYADMLVKTNNEDFGDRVFAIDCELKKMIEE